MHTFAYDRATVTLVHFMSGEFHSRDYEEMFAPIPVMDADGATHPNGALHIIVVEPGYNGGPNADQRRRVAESIESFQTKRYWFSLVTDSVLLRGVLTAISWFRPPKPGTVNATHATFDQAVEWAGKQRGTPAAVLWKLMDKARFDTTAGGIALRRRVG